MTPARTIALTLGILSLLGAIGAGIIMARRVAEYNRLSGRIIYAFMPVADNAFTYASRQVSFTDIPASPGASAAVRLAYADTELVIPASIPARAHTEHLPGLARHEDWLRVYRFAPLTGTTFERLSEDIKAGRVADRLVVVVRSLRPGADPETWGAVWRHDWIFDLHELFPDGTIRSERFSYPRSRRGARADESPGPPELDPRSWQFQAASAAMPAGSQPRIVAGDSPLRAVGWTFPVAAGCVFLSIALILIALAPGGAAPRITR